MEGPDDLDIILLDELKEHRKIDVAVMQVVKVNDIRTELFDLAQEVPSREDREAPVISGVSAQLLMDVVRYLVAYVDAVFVLCLVPVRVETADYLMSVRAGHISDLTHYVARTGKIYDVDLKYLHFPRFLTASLNMHSLSHPGASADAPLTMTLER